MPSGPPTHQVAPLAPLAPVPVSPTQLTSNNFNSFVHSGADSLVEFYADWCGACQQVSRCVRWISRYLHCCASSGPSSRPWRRVWPGTMSSAAWSTSTRSGSWPGSTGSPGSSTFLAYRDTVDMSEYIVVQGAAPGAGHQLHRAPLHRHRQHRHPASLLLGPGQLQLTPSHNIVVLSCLQSLVAPPCAPPACLPPPPATTPAPWWSPQPPSPWWTTTRPPVITSWTVRTTTSTTTTTVRTTTTQQTTVDTCDFICTAEYR